jgi:DNA gyrase/topoisomerase IV subunit A
MYSLNGQVRDESGKDVRVVVEVKDEADLPRVEKQLLRMTRLQVSVQVITLGGSTSFRATTRLRVTFDIYFRNLDLQSLARWFWYL